MTLQREHRGGKLSVRIVSSLSIATKAPVAMAAAASDVLKGDLVVFALADILRGSRYTGNLGYECLIARAFVAQSVLERQFGTCLANASLRDSTDQPSFRLQHATPVDVYGVHC